jgi:N-acetylglucosaminyldiphosphoundecaprenol N-acetyl-beta-D-mannosaminyltransferase
MYANRKSVHVPMMLGIGVSFELVAGIITRAPAWMQRNGLEWLFRLLMEPERLWKRYLIGNVKFCALILREFIADLTAHRR